MRGADGKLITNTPIGVRVSLLKGEAEGSAVYTEIHKQSTNANGVLLLEIGVGSVVEDNSDFSTIDWGNGPFFIKTEMDVTGGTNYSLTTTQQLLSVPYALFAGNTTNESQLLAQVEQLQKELDSVKQNNLKNQVEQLQKQLDSIHENSIPAEDGQPCKGAKTLKDVDGNVYNTVQIGEQCWMKENLRTTKFADGTEIPLNYVTSTENAYRYYPNQDSVNVDTYGYVYNGRAARRSWGSSNSNPSHVQGICPQGWHLPSLAEWEQLINYVKSSSDNWCSSEPKNIAKALASTELWTTSDNNCTVGNTPSDNNATKFSALPAGADVNSTENGFKTIAAFWTSTCGTYDTWLNYILLSYDTPTVGINNLYMDISSL